MKKLIVFFLALLLLLGSFANTASLATPKKATEFYILIGSNGQKISLMELSQISQAGLVTLTGRKMNMVEKVAFKIIQRKLRNSIDPDGTFNKRFAKKLERMTKGTKGFHAGGFFLGLLLGIFGVLLCYLIKDEKKAKMHVVKWAWIGFGVWLVSLITYLALWGVFSA